MYPTWHSSLKFRELDPFRSIKSFTVISLTLHEAHLQIDRGSSELEIMPLHEMNITVDVGRPRKRAQESYASSLGDTANVGGKHQAKHLGSGLHVHLHIYGGMDTDPAHRDNGRRNIHQTVGPSSQQQSKSLRKEAVKSDDSEAKEQQQSGFRMSLEEGMVSRLPCTPTHSMDLFIAEEMPAYQMADNKAQPLTCPMGRLVTSHNCAVVLEHDPEPHCATNELLLDIGAWTSSVGCTAG